MSTTASGSEFYRKSMRALKADGIPFLVGGAAALRCHAGVVRDTKDLDLMMRRADVPRALEALRRAGYRADVVFEHWLAKAHHGPFFVDIIFNSGNAICPVDDAWFQHAAEGEAFGEAVILCPAEEMIWQKAFVMERERFDGADIAHLIRARGARLDWERLLARFGPHPGVLLAHLLLVRFAYPGDVEPVPTWVLDELITRERALPRGDTDVCNGPLLSRAQYLADVETTGTLRDARLEPDGPMTSAELRRWTNAIERDGPTGL